MRGLPYRCLLASNDARTSTRSRRSVCACADSGRCAPRVEAAAARPPEHRQRCRDGVARPSPPRSSANFTGWCFAKKAAAFFRMSRSIRSSRISLRSRASSSRSAVVRPVLPFVRSARACSTHFRSADSVRSRSRATARDRLALVEDQPDRAWP